MSMVQDAASPVAKLIKCQGPHSIPETNNSSGTTSRHEMEEVETISRIHLSTNRGLCVLSRVIRWVFTKGEATFNQGKRPHTENRRKSRKRVRLQDDIGSPLMSPWEFS
ncbi:hypothetical protein PROFUN_15736 [Planoprotostelium fungivorum]|uniref:Uncharacterized protein n=1 Tax=Planoprotostelium fungivorum TaxID=1890364 RepID=A0A2P6MUQ3_9EUKA|nr:hypothetical protein PROFUN_15736 [Planoprotostelium fungivorum]